MKETGNKVMFNADVEAFLTLPSAIKLVSLLMLIARDIGHPCQTTWVHLADKQTVNISKHWKTFTRMKTTCSIFTTGSTQSCLSMAVGEKQYFSRPLRGII